MIQALVILGVILLTAALLLLLTLVVRRVQLAREEQRYADAERRVRPIAIALVEDEPTELPVSTFDQEVLADVLGRYSRRLTGEAETQIAAYFRDSSALRDALAALGSRRAWRRAAAAYRLGDMRCDEVGPELLEALDDRDRAVRGASARSLGKLHVTESAQPLVEALAARRVPNGIAGEALVALGDGALPALRRLAAHLDPQVRMSAVRLIGLIGGSQDASAAEEALRDLSADVRAVAACALGRIGAARAEPNLRAALDDQMPSVRAEAAGALGAIGSSAAVPRLLDVARTDEFTAGRAAAQAVARIDPEALTAAAATPDAGSHLHEAADLLEL